jgi:hypothetical protein
MFPVYEGWSSEWGLVPVASWIPLSSRWRARLSQVRVCSTGVASDVRRSGAGLVPSCVVGWRPWECACEVLISFSHVASMSTVTLRSIIDLWY